jgi:hypothetical protein
MSLGMMDEKREVPTIDGFLKGIKLLLIQLIKLDELSEEKDAIESLNKDVADFDKISSSADRLELVARMLGKLEAIQYDLKEEHGSGGSNALQTAISELMKFTNYYGFLVAIPNNIKSVSESSLKIEQQRLVEQKELTNNTDFKELLRQTKKYANNNNHARKRIFISYAWPLDFPNSLNESDAQIFAATLEQDLKFAGLLMHRDQSKNYGENTHTFMLEQITKADHVIVICNRTMRNKFYEHGDKGVVEEFGHYTKRIAEKRKKNQHKDFILLVETTYEDNAPGYLSQWPRDSVYQIGYLQVVYQLIRKTYGMGDKFKRNWDTELKKSKILESYWHLKLRDGVLPKLIDSALDTSLSTSFVADRKQDLLPHHKVMRSKANWPWYRTKIGIVFLLILVGGIAYLFRLLLRENTQFPVWGNWDNSTFPPLPEGRVTPSSTPYITATSQTQISDIANDDMRVGEEKTSDKPSSIKTIVNIPARLSYYQNRSKELEQIKQKMQSHKLAVVGIPGSGKSELVKEYARYRQLTGTSLVWWLEARTLEGFKNSLVSLANKFDINVSEYVKGDPKSCIEEIIGKLRPILKNYPRALLIFDSANSLDMAEIIAKFTDLDLDILVTTEESNFYTADEVVDLNGGMDSKEAVQLMTHLSGINNTAEAFSLVEELDRLPLFISTAGSYIRMMNDQLPYNVKKMSIRDYEEQLKRLPVARLDRYEAPIRERDSSGYKKTQYAVIRLSIEQLRTSSPGAKKLLDFCSVIYREKIPFHMLLEFTKNFVMEEESRAELGDWLMRLRNLSLLNINGDYYYIHQVVQRVNQEFYYKDVILNFPSIVNATLAEYPSAGDNGYEALAKYAYLNPHLQSLANFTESYEAKIKKSSRTLVGKVYYYLAGTYFYLENMEQIYIYVNKAIRVWRKDIPSNRLDLMEAYNTRGFAQRHLSYPVEEERSNYNMALSISNNDTLVEASRSYNNLAVSYYDHEDYQVAIEYFRQTISIKLIHPDDSNKYNLPINFYNLARINNRLNRIANAQRCYLKALVLQYITNSTCVHPLIAQTISDYACLLGESGEQENAIRNFDKALSISRDFFKDKQHTAVAYVYSRFGFFNFNFRRNSELALAYSRKAYLMYNSTIKENHWRTREMKADLECMESSLTSGNHTPCVLSSTRRYIPLMMLGAANESEELCDISEEEMTIARRCLL